MKKPAGGRKKKWRPTGSAEEQDGGGGARRPLSITTSAGASPEAGGCGLRAAGAQEAAGCPQISRWRLFSLGLY